MRSEAEAQVPFYYLCSSGTCSGPLLMAEEYSSYCFQEGFLSPCSPALPLRHTISLT